MGGSASRAALAPMDPLDHRQGDSPAAHRNVSPGSHEDMKVPQWFEAARVDEIANRGCKVITLNGSAVAVFNLDGEYFALEDLCTHLGSDLSSGWVMGDRTVCPWHMAEFSIRTGEALKAPAYERVRTFPVRIRDATIEVCDDRQ